MSGQFLTISDTELARARERVKEPAWKPAADALRVRAQDALRHGRQLPAFDSAWYDAQPDRDFGETYVLFHDYWRPVTRLMSDAQTLLVAGSVFGEASWLDTAAAWALHVAHHGRFHVQHHDAGMGYAHAGEPLADLYRVLGDRMPDPDRAQLRDAVAACGEAIATNHRHWRANLARMPYNNHLACHMRALVALGLTVDRPEWITPVLEGDKGFGPYLVGATYDDGLCYESSTGYHFATLHFLHGIAELARHHPDLGRDLYTESHANGRTLKDMFDAPLRLLWPNGELPALGDCYANRAPLWNRAAAAYEIAYAVYADPHYAWLLRQADERASLNALLYGVDDLPVGDPVPCRSRIWVEHGYGLVACGASEASTPAVAAVLTGDRAGVHNHRDTLSTQLFAGGHLWTEDVESRAVEAHSFSAPIQTAFNRTGLAHNLVMVDARSPAPMSTPLPVTTFTQLPDCHTLTMTDADGRLYEGVAIQRTLAVTPDYALDICQVASDTTHTLDWLLHPRSDGPAACDLSFTPTNLPGDYPYAVLRNPESAPCAADGVSLRWSQTDATFCMAVSAGIAGTLVRAEWPVASDGSQGWRDMYILRVEADRAAFVALGQVMTDGEPWRVASAERVFNGKDEEVHVVVVCGEDKRRHVVATV